MITSDIRSFSKKYNLSLIISLSLLILMPIQKGWSPATYRAVCLDALKLMPSSLRGIFLLHQQKLLQGLQHQSPQTAQINHLINRQTDKIVSMIDGKEKFAQICFQFGNLCRLASDMNNPLFMDSQDPEENLYYDNFIILTEKNLQNFVLTFDGYESNLLEKNKLNNYIKNTLEQSEELYPYFRQFMLLNGHPLEVSAFTPRSIPFALASICYCRSVGTTANLWLYTWKRAHGDLTETPFYSKKKYQDEQPALLK